MAVSVSVIYPAVEQPPQKSNPAECLLMQMVPPAPQKKMFSFFKILKVLPAPRFSSKKCAGCGQTRQPDLWQCF
jgi:hypothetical protein